ncbi:flavodoxin domain-containing protein [Neobacillus drentensis]|uniref:flavodoxin domain-containing protein n=1 Tax=Neobacillus drentensis TaxID=220684 RepID=UPI001F3C9574|nr:flavodoxin domain-containing protein [Neobacillus drentensis]ULT59191.1 flavodoxin domain-containing protein [Neobacillus drentensis]
MKSLIVYCSSHGTTEKVVGILSEHLAGEVVSVDLKRDKTIIDLNDYDTVIIGGSIHAGMIQRRIKKFIQTHHHELLEKDLGLFLVCMRQGELAVEQFNNAYPQDLRKNSVALGLFGGEFLVSEMNFFERQVVKKVDGITADQSKLDMDAIMEFASRFNDLKMKV